MSAFSVLKRAYHQSVEDLMTEREIRKAIIQFSQHASTCMKVATNHGHIMRCTCGLDDLLAKVKAHDTAHHREQIPTNTTAGAVGHPVPNAQ
jgi:hypothetical protein